MPVVPRYSGAPVPIRAALTWLGALMVTPLATTVCRSLVVLAVPS